MRTSRFIGQVVVRNFAFANQEYKLTAEGTSCTPCVPECEPHVLVNSRARDLHARADQMFALGYQASGWRLRKQAWQLEGTL